MLLAIWDYGPASFLVSGFTSGAVAAPFEIERHSARRCDELLRAGQVDVALVPTLDVAKDPDAYDVLPAIALSTWRYPYAKLMLKQGLAGPIRTVTLDPAHVQEAHQVQVTPTGSSGFPVSRHVNHMRRRIFHFPFFSRTSLNDFFSSFFCPERDLTRSWTPPPAEPHPSSVIQIGVRLSLPFFSALRTSLIWALIPLRFGEYGCSATTSKCFLIPLVL